MRPIATDTNDFPSLRRDGKIYVDKTMYVHRMVSDANTRLFFISRPRRFGKSLTLSVLKALFTGRRELFEGLYIDKTDWTWEKYPVIHFEFNDVTTTSVAEFETSFAIHVQERLEKAGFAYDKSLPPPENFGNAIESLSAANGGKGTAWASSQGVEYRAEDVQSNGRADVIATHKKGIFIFELKVDEPVESAFRCLADREHGIVPSTPILPCASFRPGVWRCAGFRRFHALHDPSDGLVRLIGYYLVFGCAHD